MDSVARWRRKEKVDAVREVEKAVKGVIEESFGLEEEVALKNDLECEEVEEKIKWSLIAFFFILK